MATLTAVDKLQMQQLCKTEASSLRAWEFSSRAEVSLSFLVVDGFWQEFNTQTLKRVVILVDSYGKMYMYIKKQITMIISYKVGPSDRYKWSEHGAPLHGPKINGLHWG